MARLTRREALAALAGGVLSAPGCGDGSRRSVTASQTPAGGVPLSFNVHPLGGRFEALQREALRRLAPPWIRVTLADTGAARPYIRAVPNALGLLADFRSGPINAAEWPAFVETTLKANPGVRRVQLLHDPARHGLSAEHYVQEFLRPAYERIRERVSGVMVVAAAPDGDRKRVPERFRRLTAAGVDDFCDYRAVNVYFDDSAALSAIAGATRRPILVTETGTGVPSQHVRWYTEVVPRIRASLGAEQVFWYVLLESAALAGGTVPYSHIGFSVIDAGPSAAGQAHAARGSGLYPLLAGTALTRRR